MYSTDGVNSRQVFRVQLFIVVAVLFVLSKGNGEESDVGNEWNDINNKAGSSSNFSAIGDDDDNMLNEKIGLFVHTQYCGPGERVWKSRSSRAKIHSPATYAKIDVCCKNHDECPNYISSESDYSKYTGLPHKQQLWSRLKKQFKKKTVPLRKRETKMLFRFLYRLECACDGQFFSCLNSLNIQYANTIAFGYGVVQSQCFAYDYPIVGCNKYS